MSNTMLGPVADVPIRPAPSVFSYGPKCPCCLSTLHSLTYGPHMSASSFLSSLAAVAAVHPRPCARAPAMSSEVEKTAAIGAGAARVSTNTGEPRGGLEELRHRQRRVLLHRAPG